MAKAQKGDLIRIVKNVEHAYGGYKIGDILEVAGVDVYGDGNDVTVTSNRCFLYDDEYEIHRKQAHAAQGGDLIRITKVRDGVDAYKLGGIYEVISLDASHYDQIVIEGEGGAEGFVFADEYEVFRKAGEEAADAVNHPNHYTQGRVEVIDVIEDAVAGADAFEAVCQANVLKYMLRYRHKNGVEDVKKAVWYANKLIEHLDAKTTE